jgi:hypothetical protein
MAKPRSFERFNYTLRPNKNIERKLLVELLSAFEASDQFRLKNYRYVGLSSIYYADAILVHKRLGIEDIVSIEYEKSRKARVEFNRPYECVKIEMDPVGEVIPRLTWTKPQFVWLDYDGTLSLSMFSDVEMLLARLKSRDFLFISVNAEIAQIDGVKQEEHELTRPQAFRRVVPESCLPYDFEERLTTNGFASVIGEVWDTFIRSTVLARGIDLKLLPLFNLTYADGARMVTYGGVLVSAADLAIVDGLELKDQFDYVGGASQVELAAPQLTHLEKITLDRLMPSGTCPDHGALPFELKPSEVEAYWRYYLHYPSFGELAP